MRLDAAGNLGIGTNAPTTPLQIALAASNANQIASQITVAGNPLVSLGERENANYGGMLKLHDGAGGAGYAMLEYNGGYPQIRTSSDNVSLTFSGGALRANSAYFDYIAGGGTKFYVSSGGDTGIGTTSPQSRLDVAGGTRVGADATCSAAKAGMLVWNSNTLQVCTDAGTFTDLANSSGIIGGASSQWVDGTGGAIYYNGGNVGIGTATPQALLDVTANSASEKGIFIGHLE